MRALGLQWHTHAKDGERETKRGPWGKLVGGGWLRGGRMSWVVRDKGVKIIARSSLEADRWLLHSPPSSPWHQPPVHPSSRSPNTFTDPWDSVTGQTKNGRFAGRSASACQADVGVWWPRGWYANARGICNASKRLGAVLPSLPERTLANRREERERERERSRPPWEG